MTKLCPRGKSAAKRKFAVYPSAYANAYASKISLAKKKKKNKKSDFGMLSVKAGIDKNPNPTHADRIAAGKMKNKKKVIG